MPAPIVGVLAVKALSGALYAVGEHYLFQWLDEQTGDQASFVKTFIEQIVKQQRKVKGLSTLGLYRVVGGTGVASYYITTAALNATDMYDLLEEFYVFIDEKGPWTGERIPPPLPPRQPGEAYRKLDDVMYRYISSHVIQPKIESFHRLKRISFPRQYAVGVSFLGVKEWTLNSGKITLAATDVNEYTQSLYPYINLPYIVKNDELEQIKRIIINTLESEVNEKF